MFSGKSTALYNEITRYSVISDKILVVNNVLDKQRNKSKTLRTHDNKEYPALFVENLRELKDTSDYANAKIVVIDEGQFYLDLFLFISTELTISNKLFIVGSLCGDYQMQPIGDVLRLVPLADEITKLHAYCVECKDGTIASFTKAKLQQLPSEGKFVVGNSNLYKPVCRYHFYN